MAEKYNVSVLTPVRNTPMDLLHRAFDSLKNQSYGFAAMEWVVVLHNCDSSYIGEVSRLLGGEKNVSLEVCDKPGSGVSFARNKTLELAHGKWLFFLDSDDEMEKDCIREVVERMEAAGADTGVFGAGLDPGGILLPFFPDGVPGEDLVLRHGDERMGKALCESGLVLWTRCYRQDFLRRKGLRFDETLEFGEDYAFNLSATALAASMAVFPDLTGCRHYLSEGMTSGFLADLKKKTSSETLPVQAKKEAGSFASFLGRLYEEGRRQGIFLDNLMWFQIRNFARPFLVSGGEERERFLDGIRPLLAKLRPPEMLNPSRQSRADWIYKEILALAAPVPEKGRASDGTGKIPDVPAGCRVIGMGRDATVYDYGEDLVLKVFQNRGSESEEMIRREQCVSAELRRLRIPAAYVRGRIMAGDAPALLYDKIHGETLGHIALSEPDRLKENALLTADFIRRLHTTHAGKGILPDARCMYADFVRTYEQKGFFTEAERKRLLGLIDDVPFRDTMVHRDLSWENLMVQDGKLLLIDLDSMALGHPLWDLATMYQNIVLCAEMGMTIPGRFPSREQSWRFFRFFLIGYLGTDEPEVLTETVRMLRNYCLLWNIRIAMELPLPGMTREARFAYAQKCKEKLFSCMDEMHPVPDAL